ncbi:DivIVA domain-containing protein [Streptomyces bottropensis]
MQQDGMSTDITLNSAQEADGFAAIMKRLKGRSAQERAALKVQADQAVLGYEAYALGHEYLERGELDAARRWLQVAAGHRIPGAEQALEEMAVRQPLDDVAALTAVNTAVIVDPMAHGTVSPPSGVCITDGVHPGKNDQPWAAVLENLRAARQASSARTEAVQITEQARREADILLAEVQRQAQAMVDDARAEAERILGAARRQAAEEAKAAAAARGGELVTRPQVAGPLYVSRVRKDVGTWDAQELANAVLQRSGGGQNLRAEFLGNGALEALRSHWPVQHATRRIAVLRGCCGEAEPYRLTMDDLLLFGVCLVRKHDVEDAGAREVALLTHIAHLPWREEGFDHTGPVHRAAAAHVVSESRLFALGAGCEGPKEVAAIDAEESV